MVADYVKETGNHVLYRVTPVFEEQNLLAKGVQMEAMSVEDQGEGISYNVFVYNVQPGIYIDYKTGESSLDQSHLEQTDSQAEGEIRGNSRSKIYHCPGQATNIFHQPDHILLYAIRWVLPSRYFLSPPQASGRFQYWRKQSRIFAGHPDHYKFQKIFLSVHLPKIAVYFHSVPHTHLRNKQEDL